MIYKKENYVLIIKPNIKEPKVDAFIENKRTGAIMYFNRDVVVGKEITYTFKTNIFRTKVDKEERNIYNEALVSKELFILGQTIIDFLIKTEKQAIESILLNGKFV